MTDLVPNLAEVPLQNTPSIVQPIIANQGGPSPSTPRKMVVQAKRQPPEGVRVVPHPQIQSNVIDFECKMEEMLV